MFAVKVSVVLPTFNGQRFVREAIESVLHESEVGQLIIVDDSSTDSTLAEVQSLTSIDHRIEVIALRRNVGVAAARNQGVKAARCDWLSFIDQDDLWVGGRTQRLLSAIDAIEESFSLGSIDHFLDVNAPSNVAPSWVRERWVSQSRPGWVLGAMLTPTAVFRKVGLFDESLINGTDDFDWFLRAKRIGVAINIISDVVVRRRLHSANLSGSAKPNHELLGILRSHLANHHERGKDDS